MQTILLPFYVHCLVQDKVLAVLQRPSCLYSVPLPVTTQTTLVPAIWIELQCFLWLPRHSRNLVLPSPPSHIHILFRSLWVEFCLQEQRITITPFTPLPPAKDTHMHCNLLKRKKEKLLIRMDEVLVVVNYATWLWWLDDLSEEIRNREEKVLYWFVQPIIVFFKMLWLFVFQVMDMFFMPPIII